MNNNNNSSLLDDFNNNIGYKTLFAIMPTYAILSSISNLSEGKIKNIIISNNKAKGPIIIILNL